MRPGADQSVFGSGQAPHDGRGTALSGSVEVRDQGRCIARHERQQQVLELEHYLDVLERKPGALAGSKPLAAWRQRGLWPESYDRLLEQLIRRHGKQSGTRQIIEVLNLIREHGHARVRAGGGRGAVAGLFG